MTGEGGRGHHTLSSWQCVLNLLNDLMTEHTGIYNEHNIQNGCILQCFDL